jgi:hypothetical protein
MERGLIWTPLLILFFGLAWAGWREFRKVDAYQTWATQFDRAKYDIYSVLGQKGSELTWGKPTVKGPVDLATFSLETVQKISLLVNNQLTPFDTAPAKGKAVLEFVGDDRPDPIQIPFTEPQLAAKWGEFLEKELQRVHPEHS